MLITINEKTIACLHFILIILEGAYLLQCKLIYNQTRKIIIKIPSYRVINLVQKHQQIRLEYSVLSAATELWMMDFLLLASYCCSQIKSI